MDGGQVRTDFLRGIPIFEGVPAPVIERFAQGLEVRRCEPGALLFKEGDASRELFIVLGGELEVMKRSKRGRDARIAVVGMGDSIGEMSIVDDQPRSATVMAVSPSQLMRLGADDLARLAETDLRSYATILHNVAREISRRLRVADGIIADFVAQVWDAYLAPTHKK
jgi:CRP-like cAMP-binding protein